MKNKLLITFFAISAFVSAQKIDLGDRREVEGGRMEWEFGEKQGTGRRYEAEVRCNWGKRGVPGLRLLHGQGRDRSRCGCL